MIEASVDLPAPFSPSSAIASPGRTSSLTSLRTVIGPYFLPMPRRERPPTLRSDGSCEAVMTAAPARSGRGGGAPPTPLVLRMLVDETRDVVLRRQRRVLKLLRRQLVALHQRDRRVEAHAAHLLRLLRGGDVEHAVLEGLQRRRVAIEAGHPDVMIGVGDLDRLRRAERQRIGLAEDDGRLRVRLKQVGGQLEAFVLVPTLAPEFADDLDVGIVLKCDAAAFRPVDFGGRALLSVDNQ